MSNNPMKELQSVSFAMMDIKLFLDTHPFEVEALNYYLDCKKKQEQILQEYEKNYGPILSGHVNNNDHWTWVDQPWPWEGEV